MTAIAQDGDEKALALLRGSGFVGDNVFDEASSGNRDGSFTPYVQLRKHLAAYGIALRTADIGAAATPAFEIHQDVQRASKAAVKYLVMLETPLVWRLNSQVDLIRSYRKVFTWDDTLVDGHRFIKINFPNALLPHEPDGFKTRHRIACIIAGNKSLRQRDDRDLYSRRIEAIRWFERHAPYDFDLFGTGWDEPPASPGLASRLARKVRAFAPKVSTHGHFPSYRGRVKTKAEVLKHTRFSICYENVAGFSGYITEKIFDCFLAGCVPIYWGAVNVADHVPANCFLDRRAFASTADVYARIVSMTEREFVDIQTNIAEFMVSPAARQFGIEAFVQTVVETIIRDLPVGERAV